MRGKLGNFLELLTWELAQLQHDVANPEVAAMLSWLMPSPRRESSGSVASPEVPGEQPEVILS